MPLPRIRPNLDAYPVRVRDREVIALHDSEGLLEGPVLLPRPTFFVATLLDGRRDVVDVQAEYARRTGGDLLFSWDLQRIIEDLDRHGLLDSPALQARRDAVETAFRAAAARPSSHAGTAYPAEPDALRAMLAQHLDAVDRSELAGLRPRGIIAPHIDFARGGWCYGWAHAAVADHLSDTCLLLGVAHSGPPVPVILTTKPFVTPLGEVQVDADAARVLQARLGDLTAYEIVHRTEHSLEFQVVFLQAVRGRRPPAIVPLLVSGLERWVSPGRTPRDIDAVEDIVAALRDLVGTSSPEMTVVVSVDFSHVGPRFGDREPVGPGLASRTSIHDREVLEAIVNGDADAFWRRVTADGNPYRIDALSATYLALRMLEPVRGRLLRYGQAEDPAGGIVSFASLALM